MEFGIPVGVEGNYPKHREPLKAEGNLDYLQFIALLQGIWAEAHPDIPIKPTQSKTFVKYPVIVYGLQLRKPMNVEPKQRYREEISRPDEETNIIINAQRFENVISFEVRTQGNPEMAEAIIEVFEDFMQEYTPVFKRLGVSDLFYMRRTPDGEETRRDEDVEVRTVAYMVTLEKIRVTESRKLKELTVRARTMLHNEGNVFHALTDDQTWITVINHNYRLYDFISLQGPHSSQTYDTIPRQFPEGLWVDTFYQITEIDGDDLYLSYLNGDPIHITQKGMGRHKQAPIPYGDIEIEDNLQTATPNN